jgi:hypothetical protein
MTHIHEIGVPPAPTVSHERKSTFRYVVYGVTLVIAALNALAAINLYKVTAEVRGIDRRLSELSAFEKRLIQKIDGMNNGVQSQFDRVNSNIQASLDEKSGNGSRSTGDPEEEFRADDIESQIPSWNKFTTNNIQSQYSKFTASTEESDQRAEAEFAELTESGPRYDSVSYERIVDPDGKTFYRKKY